MKTHFAIVGFVLGVLGGVILTRRIHLYFFGVRASAVFSKWEMRGLRRPAHHPVVRFVAQDGKEYEVTSLAGGRPQPDAKESYAVIYQISNPQKELVYSFIAYWMAPFALFLLSFAAFYTSMNIPE